MDSIWPKNQIWQKRNIFRTVYLEPYDHLDMEEHHWVIRGAAAQRAGLLTGVTYTPHSERTLVRLIADRVAFSVHTLPPTP